MFSYYTINHAGRIVHIIKAQSDDNEDVQLSLMSLKYDDFDPMKLASLFYDSPVAGNSLEADGWTKIGAVNGGIFNIPFANGLEKSFWQDHEMADDYILDDVMAVGHYGGANNGPVVDTQAAIRANGGSYRGAVTGAFGLMKGGSVVQGNTSRQGSYSSLSGRTIVGKDSSGAMYLIATPGVTGSSGLTGAQCLDLVQNVMGLSDAVCMDGGGSVSLIYQGVWKVSTNREVKNAFAIYVKANGGGGGGGGVVVSGKKDSYTPTYESVMPHKIYIDGNLVDLVDIQIKTPNGMVSIIDDEVKGE